MLCFSRQNRCVLTSKPCMWILIFQPKGFCALCMHIDLTSYTYVEVFRHTRRYMIWGEEGERETTWWRGPVTKLSLFLSLIVCCRLLTEEGGGLGGVWWRESLVLFISLSFNTLWLQLCHLTPQMPKGLQPKKITILKLLVFFLENLKKIFSLSQMQCMVSIWKWERSNLPNLSVYSL